ncbi:STAS domain-containing protein [soil metagenome]
MNIERTEQNGVTILSLDGRLDASAVSILDQAFASAFSQGSRKFVWDFQKLTYISSAGLRSVLQALKSTGASKGKLSIAQMSPQVMEVFEISGFKDLITICPDVPSAIVASA